VPQALSSFGYIGASQQPLPSHLRCPSTVPGSGLSPNSIGLYCFVNLIFRGTLCALLINGPAKLFLSLSPTSLPCKALSLVHRLAVPPSNHPKDMLGNFILLFDPVVSHCVVPGQFLVLRIAIRRQSRCLRSQLELLRDACSLRLDSSVELHTCALSDSVSSASVLLEPTVSKHLRQMESRLPSLFRL